MMARLQHLQFLTAPAAFCCACVLAGCNTAPLAPVEVKVPVAVPCVTAALARPIYEFDRLPATASAGDKVLALARDWVRAKKYEGDLEAIIISCRSF